MLWGIKTGEQLTIGGVNLKWTFPTEENFKGIARIRKNKGIIIFENKDGIKAEYEKRKAEYEKRKASIRNKGILLTIHDNQNNVWHFDRTTGEEESAGGRNTKTYYFMC